jgi:hypothetical protein
MVTKTKAKRKLSDISFEHDGAHIALVSKEQGGPANMQDYALVMKSTSNFSDEFIQKAQLVRVTLELPEFLQTFFHLYEDDAETLAAMFGYKEQLDAEGEEVEDDAGTYSNESFYSWYKEKMQVEYWYDAPEPTDADYQEYINSRLQGIEILKGIQSSESLPEALSKLTEDDYLSVLRDQERVEKALANKEKLKAKSDKPKTKKVIAKTVTQEVTDEQIVNDSSKEIILMKQTEQKTVAQVEVEVVEKAQLTELQKAFEAQKEALEKATALVAKFEAEQKAALEKARKASIVAAVKDEAKAEVLFKAVAALESQEDFDAVVKVLGELTVQVETSELFKETGVSGEGDGVKTESAVAKALKAQLKSA